MKKLGLITISTFLLAKISSGAIYEYPYLYKDPRVLGMGGAYTAVGGTGTSIFYNPAGLSNLNPKSGFEVDLLGLNLSTNQNSLDFLSDFSDALDTGDLDHDGDSDDDKLEAVNNVLKQYRGKNLHLNIANYSSVSKKINKIGLSIGFLVGTKFDGKTHQGFSSEGVLELNYNTTAGLFFGASYDTLDGDLSLGLGLKYVYRNSLYHNFTSRELVEHQDNLDEYITDELAKSDSAISGDIGLIYRVGNKIPKLKKLNMSLGFSLLNIGDLDFKEAGKIPMTANIGMSINPKVPYLNNFIFSADYIDITEQYDDSSKLKRLRFGGEASVYENKWVKLALRAGLYEGYISAGADLRLGVLQLTFTTYGEEVGAAQGQDEDRRYILSMFLTW